MPKFYLSPCPTPKPSTIFPLTFHYGILSSINFLRYSQRSPYYFQNSSATDRPRMGRTRDSACLLRNPKIRQEIPPIHDHRKPADVYENSRYPEYMAQNDSDIVGPIMVPEYPKTFRTFYEYRYHGKLYRPADTRFTPNGVVCKLVAWFFQNNTYHIIYDGRLPEFRINIDYRLRSKPVSIQTTLQNAIARLRQTRINVSRRDAYQRRMRQERPSPFRRSQHRTVRETVKIPTEKFGSNSTLKSKIEQLPDNHYFRHAGRIIGAASFAHISMEINIDQIKYGMEKACACAYTKLDDVFPKLTSQGTTKYGLQQRMETIQALCDQQLTEIEEARFSFSALDTQITSNSETIDKFLQYFSKDKPSEQI